LGVEVEFVFLISTCRRCPQVECDMGLSKTDGRWPMPQDSTLRWCRPPRALPLRRSSGFGGGRSRQHTKTPPRPENRSVTFSALHWTPYRTNNPDCVELFLTFYSLWGGRVEITRCHPSSSLVVLEDRISNPRIVRQKLHAGRA